MSDRETYVVERSNPRASQVLEKGLSAIRDRAARGDVQFVVSDVVRSRSQNDAMWPALTDFAAQVPWPVTQRDGSTRQATKDDMKDILTAAFEDETAMAPGLRGGFVMVGSRTSKYGKRKMAEFLTFLRSEGIDRGVQWSEKAEEKFEEYAKYVKQNG